jgi:PKD repeat protein
VLTINGNTTVIAIFNVLPPPIANFTGSPLSGEAPLTVNFIDTSSNPSSWSWSFGDGDSSSQKKPSHIYKTPGTYSVSLNVSNGSGSDALTKTGYVTVSSCPNPPIRIAGANPQYYSSLQNAYNSAVDGDTLQIQALDFSENVSLDRNLSVTLKGGFDCGYTTSYPNSVINGSLTISDGTVALENIETL